MALPTSGDGESTGTPNLGTQTPTPGAEGGEATFTKAQMDAAVTEAVTERMEQETRTRGKKIDDAGLTAVQAFREKHGLDDDAIEQFSTSRQRDSVNGEALSKANLAIAARTRDADAARSERDAAVATLTKERATSALDKALLDYPGQIKPESMADLRTILGPKVSVDAEGKSFVKGDDGEPLPDTNVGTYVAEQLEKRKHWLEPTAVGGAGSRGGGQPLAPEGKPDLTTAKGMGELATSIVNAKRE